jgi:hypothetical protein
MFPLVANNIPKRALMPLFFGFDKRCKNYCTVKKISFVDKTKKINHTINDNDTVAGKAIGFALEQPLHVVALPCSAP